MEAKTPATTAAAPKAAVQAMTEENSVIVRMAKAYGIKEGNLLKSLKAIIFKDPKVSDDEAQAFMLVADKYGLDPWTRQIYPALTKQGSILPVVGVDGWCAIINNHPQADGLKVIPGPKKPMGEILHRSGSDSWLQMEAPEEITVEIYRKDRKYPVTVSETMAECFRATDPWKSHPARMLRHKAIIQAARIAFGFTGIYDPDEAEAIREVHMGPAEVVAKPVYEKKGMTLEAYVKAIIDRVQERGAPLTAAEIYLSRPEFNLSKADLSVVQRMIAEAQNKSPVQDDILDVEPNVTPAPSPSPSPSTNAKPESSSEAKPSDEEDDAFGLDSEEV